MNPRGAMHSRTECGIYHDIKYELEHVPTVPCALSDANATWSSHYYKRFTTGMRLFRKRNEDTELYTYRELSNHDRDVDTGSRSPTVIGSPLDFTSPSTMHFNDNFQKGGASVPLPRTQCQTSSTTLNSLYTDHGTQTASTPSPCYSTVKVASHKSNLIVPEHRWYNGDDVELQAITHEYVHRYPPGVVVIKTIDEEGREVIEELSFTKKKTCERPIRHEWDRLNGTGPEEGAVVKVAGKFLKTITWMMTEWKSRGRTLLIGA
ncbi:hypothetical protein J1614_000963 [Plenodomus biglobosus]|nr:hypothetical protein J1614_000963 [Plenodomus biglobosus]